MTTLMMINYGWKDLCASGMYTQCRL